MRFGNWRGAGVAPRATAVAGLAFFLSATLASAQDFHTIPRLTPAIDLNTGGPYYAPPIPYGHYAGANHGGKLGGLFGGLGAKLHGLKSGLGHGVGLGHGLGAGHGMGFGHGHGLLGKLKGHGMGLGHGLGHGTPVMATGQQVVMPAPQGTVGDPCGQPGCGLGHSGCGKGCGLLGKLPGCGACGGKGCASCAGLGHLGGLHGLAGKAHGLLCHLTGANNIKWFNGPGGPVPLTPGYVPYVNPVRSPRDFFAFPPMSEGMSGVLPIQASYSPPTAIPPVAIPAPVGIAPKPPEPALEDQGMTPPAPEAVPAPAPAAPGDVPAPAADPNDSR